jgi:hypothetical protein
MYDEARFDDEDCSEVVMASFACRVCLHAADLVNLVGGPGERIAISRCSGCGTVNHVAVSDDQTYRLWTLPRGNAFVHFAPEYW